LQNCTVQQHPPLQSIYDHLEALDQGTNKAMDLDHGLASRTL